MESLKVRVSMSVNQDLTPNLSAVPTHSGMFHLPAKLEFPGGNYLGDPSLIGGQPWPKQCLPCL